MANGKAEIIGQMFGVGTNEGNGGPGERLPHDEAAFARMTV